MKKDKKEWMFCQVIEIMLKHNFTAEPTVKPGLSDHWGHSLIIE